MATIIKPPLDFKASAVGGRINIWWLYFEPSSPSHNYIHSPWVIQFPFDNKFLKKPFAAQSWSDALFMVDAACTISNAIRIRSSSHATQLTAV